MPIIKYDQCVRKHPSKERENRNSGVLNYFLTSQLSGYYSSENIGINHKLIIIGLIVHFDDDSRLENT